MTPEELTPSIVLKWLRIQAKKHTETAQRYTDTANKFGQAAEVLEGILDPVGKTTAGHTQGVPAPHTRLFPQGANTQS